MPIKIPSKLPARQVLQQEGVLVIEEGDAIRQDIRPLRIALLNLMPEKIKTETQIARVLGATPLQVEIILLKLGTHKSKTTPGRHLSTPGDPTATSSIPTGSTCFIRQRPTTSIASAPTSRIELELN